MIWKNGLVAVGQRLGVKVEGFAVLTFLALTVAVPSGARRVEMLRLPPYDYNMARLIELEALCRDISDPNAIVSTTMSSAKLAVIMRQPPPWSGWQLRRYWAFCFRHQSPPCSVAAGQKCFAAD
jgi:hypothetical protein